MAYVVITGANRGIGYELAKQLSESGETVVAVVRSASEALNDLDIEVITDVDVCDDDLSALSEAMGNRPVKLLINNAGLLNRTTLESLDVQSIRQQFEVNTLGPLKITHCLLDNLSAGSKVAHITSRMGSVADNGSGSHYGYRMSKAAMNMATKSMALDLAQREIAVCALHPGYVRTRMTGNAGYINADEAATGLIQRIKELNLSNSGRFWHQNGEELPW